MAVGMRVWYDLGLPPKKPYGLLRTVQVVNVDNRIAVAGAESQTYFCDAAPEVGEGYCGPTVPREYDTIEDIFGDPFTLTSSVACGFAGDVRDEESRTALDYKESHGVEQHLGALMDEMGAGLPSGSPAEVVAGLETWLGDNYAGQGLIHVNVGTATLLFSDAAIEKNGSSVTTVAGTPVVIGSGYTPGTVYASGRVVILRSPLREMSSPVGVDCGGADNSARATAERTYVPLVECGAEWAVLA